MCPSVKADFLTWSIERCSETRLKRFPHYFWLTTTVSTVTISLIFVSYSNTVESQYSRSVKVFYLVVTYKADRRQLHAYLKVATQPISSKVKETSVPEPSTEPPTSASHELDPNSAHDLVAS